MICLSRKWKNCAMNVETCVGWTWKGTVVWVNVERPYNLLEHSVTYYFSKIKYLPQPNKLYFSSSTVPQIESKSIGYPYSFVTTSTTATITDEWGEMQLGELGGIAQTLCPRCYVCTESIWIKFFILFDIRGSTKKTELFMWGDFRRLLIYYCLWQNDRKHYTIQYDFYNESSNNKVRGVIGRLNL